MEKFIPFGHQTIEEDDIAAVNQVLRSDWLTQGPNVLALEEEICSYTGAKYCVAVANGTAALHLAVLSLEIEAGCEGITTPNTFAASANCLVYADLRPIFADIRPDTYNIDLKEIKKKKTEKTKVIVAVDFAGQPADLEEIHEFAKKNSIYVIEDAAHAIGSKYQDGSRVGSCKYSDITTFSFHPAKNMTTGEGGAITTNNKDIYERLKLLRSHGITKETDKLEKNPGPWYYEMQTLGYNYRLSDIQAALGVSQIGKIERFSKRRREIVKFYNQRFTNISNLIAPFEKEGVYSAFHLYVLKIDFEAIGKSRKEVMNLLREKGIGTQVHYIPVHLQPYYQEIYGYREGDFPVAEEYYGKCVSIPLYPKMTDYDAEYVADTINSIVRRDG
ncbi:MAG: UDP-4-amino-4,6-dideoxy-N-acetyl-beta-L-altrosamine transaminase [Patescibacteria group bacterium]